MQFFKCKYSKIKAIYHANIANIDMENIGQDISKCKKFWPNIVLLQIGSGLRCENIHVKCMKRMG